MLFQDVAEKFASYRDGAEKSALSMELFGKTGAKLITTLNMGKQGLAEMTAEAEAFGQVVSQESAAAAGEFNDNLFRLQSAVGGISMQIASALLPALSGITEQMVQAAKDTTAMDTAARIAVTGFRLLASAVVVVGGAFKTVGSLIGNVAGFIGEAVDVAIFGAARNITNVSKALALARMGEFDLAKRVLNESGKNTLEGYARLMSGITVIGEDFGSDIEATVGVLDAIWKDADTKAQSVATKPSGGLAAPIVRAASDAEKARKKLEDEAAKARKALEEEGRRMRESVATPIEKRDADIGNVNRLAGAGVIDPETQKRAIADAEATYQEYVTRQRDMLTEGLLSEEAQIAASYERRKQMILALTEATEQEKAAAIATLSEKAELDQASARLARYRDVMSQEQQLTIDYTARRREIENDETLGAESRNDYLLNLSKKYHDDMRRLDEEEAARKSELHAKQMQLMTDGFSGAAELTKAFAGEQSKTYQVMFAASKAFALADIAVKQSQAIAKAWGENNYWVAIGLTAGLAAQFAGLISSTQSSSFGGTRADGGPVNAGRSYLVGERGPEMFTPSQGGRIVPNDAMGSTQQAQPIRIVNAYDDGHIDDYLGSDAGEKKIINAVRRNKRALGMA